MAPGGSRNGYPRQKEGSSTIEAVNVFFPAFMTNHNTRFAKEPRLAKDLHRPVPGAANGTSTARSPASARISRHLPLSASTTGQWCSG